MQVHSCVNGLPPGALAQLLTSLVEAMSASPHLEYLLHWAKELLQRQGSSMERMPASLLAPCIRLLRQALSRMRSDIGSACTSNLYLLEYLSQAGLADQTSISDGGRDGMVDGNTSSASEDSNADLGSIQLKKSKPAEQESPKKKAKREPIRIKLQKPA